MTNKGNPVTPEDFAKWLTPSEKKYELLSVFDKIKKSTFNTYKITDKRIILKLADYVREFNYVPTQGQYKKLIQYLTPEDRQEYYI